MAKLSLYDFKCRLYCAVWDVLLTRANKFKVEEQQIFPIIKINIQYLQPIVNIVSKFTLLSVIVVRITIRDTEKKKLFSFGNTNVFPI